MFVFFCEKGQILNYFRLCEPYGLFHNYSVLCQQHENSNRQYVNRGAWLLQNETLFTKTQDWTCGPQFAKASVEQWFTTLLQTGFTRGYLKSINAWLPPPTTESFQSAPGESNVQSDLGNKVLKTCSSNHNPETSTSTGSLIHFYLSLLKKRNKIKWWILYLSFLLFVGLHLIKPRAP